jgi:hypothetical protein
LEANVNNIPTTTTDNRWLHYAVEATSSDGPFVIAKTQSLNVALAVLATRVWPDEENNLYIHASVIPYDSRYEEAVWLGFPFYHNGAKGTVAQMGHYAEDRQEVGLTKEGYSAIFDVIREEERRLMGY